jgi:hypothetical protein
VELRRRRYQQPDGSTDAVVDDLIDVVDTSVSLAVREMCCRLATDSGSFARAASNLDRLAQVRMSDEKLRQVAESEGRAVLAWEEHEQLEFDFEAASSRTSRTSDGTIKSRIYVGIDGFMLPMVSDAEMAARFEKAKVRRARLPGRNGVRRPRLRRRVGADQRYKEFKLVTLYDQEQRHRRVRATRGGVKQAGRMLRAMSEDVKLPSAEQVVAITDGAEWIARLIDTSLPRHTTPILDFYHAAQHVHEARRVVFGEDSPSGKAWADELVTSLLESSWETTWDLLISTRSRLRSPTKRKSMDALMSYLLQRRQKVAYGQFRAAGYDIGSGPTESMCKSLSRRMKGIGMRWTARNADAMVALESMHQSGLWSHYWVRQALA